MGMYKLGERFGKILARKLSLILWWWFYSVHQILCKEIQCQSTGKIEWCPTAFMKESRGGWASIYLTTSIVKCLKISWIKTVHYTHVQTVFFYCPCFLLFHLSSCFPNHTQTHTRTHTQILTHIHFQQKTHLYDHFPLTVLWKIKHDMLSHVPGMSQYECPFKDHQSWISYDSVNGC